MKIIDAKHLWMKILITVMGLIFIKEKKVNKMKLSNMNRICINININNNMIINKN
jgi:DNA-binding Xre family transcriptional regulator